MWVNLHSCCMSNSITKNWVYITAIECLNVASATCCWPHLVCTSEIPIITSDTLTMFGCKLMSRVNQKSLATYTVAFLSKALSWKEIIADSTTRCPLHHNCSMLLQLALLVLSCLHMSFPSTHTMIVHNIHSSFFVNLQTFCIHHILWIACHGK